MLTFANPLISRLMNIGIEQSIYIAILFVILWVVSSLVRKKQTLLQLGLWSILLFRCLMPTDIASHYSLRQLTFPDRPDANILTGMSYHDGMPDTGQVTNSVENATSSLVHKINWKFVIVGTWVLGSLIFFMLFSKQYHSYKHLAKNATTCQESEILKMLSNWQHLLRIKRNVQILISDESCSPFTLGLVRPILVLPQSILSKKYKSSLESIIAHELTHIRQFDSLWIWFQNMIQCLFFFHPAVWIANRKINFYRECLCDGMVISRGAIPHQTYGQSLLNSLKLSQRGPKWQGAPACFVLSKSMLTDRIKNLKGGQRMNIQKGIITLVMLVGLAYFLLPMAGVTQTNQSSSDLLTKAHKSNQNFEAIKDTQMIQVSKAVATALDLSNELTFTNPIKSTYQVSSTYGYKTHPVLNRKKFHHGIDIAARIKTPVYAAESGYVTLPKISEAYGKNIIIDHGSRIKTFYAHLDSIIIKPGMQVKKGDLIGLVGNTGKSTGPHLHFEIIKDSTRVDPDKYIQF